MTRARIEDNGSNVAVTSPKAPWPASTKHSNGRQPFASTLRRYRNFGLQKNRNLFCSTAPCTSNSGSRSSTMNPVSPAASRSTGAIETTALSVRSDGKLPRKTTSPSSGAARPTSTTARPDPSGATKVSSQTGVCCPKGTSNRFALPVGNPRRRARPARAVSLVEKTPQSFFAETLTVNSSMGFPAPSTIRTSRAPRGSTRMTWWISPQRSSLGSRESATPARPRSSVIRNDGSPCGAPAARANMNRP